MENLEKRISALGGGCRIEIKKIIPDNEGRLVLFCADGRIDSAAYIYNNGELFHLYDWQSSRPETLEEIEDFEWIGEAGEKAISLNGKPRII